MLNENLKENANQKGKKNDQETSVLKTFIIIFILISQKFLSGSEM